MLSYLVHIVCVNIEIFFFNSFSAYWFPILVIVFLFLLQNILCYGNIRPGTTRKTFPFGKLTDLSMC